MSIIVRSSEYTVSYVRIAITTYCTYSTQKDVMYVQIQYMHTE